MVSTNVAIAEDYTERYDMSKMRKIKQHRKKIECIKHREDMYCRAINKVIDGQAEPGYAAKRWLKLKEARG